MFLRSSLTPRWTVILLALAGLAMALLRPTPSHSAAPMPLERLDETCGSDNPFFVSPAYAMGDRKDEPALLAYRDGPERFVLATYDQIGHLRHGLRSAPAPDLRSGLPQAGHTLRAGRPGDDLPPGPEHRPGRALAGRA